jgi:ribosomal 50S subunit-recycling heat shock protein
MFFGMKQKLCQKKVNNLRIDKYLKVSRLLKRRTLAQEACAGGRVLVNDKVVKPGFEVKEGDVIEILFGNKNLKVKIKSISEHVRKDESKELYEIL